MPQHKRSIMFRSKYSFAKNMTADIENKINETCKTQLPSVVLFLRRVTFLSYQMTNIIIKS